MTNMWRVLLMLGVTSVSVVVATPVQGQNLPAARRALDNGEYDDAIRMLRRAARSSDPAATRLLVRALTEIGEYGDAADAARSFMAREPASPELWTALGSVLYETGQIDDAEAAFRRAIQGGASDSVTAEVALGMLEYRRGDRDGAMARFDRFIDYYNGRDALSSEALTAVGVAVEHLGADRSSLFRDAMRAYDEAVAADSGYPEAWLRLGELFLSKYNSTDAGETFGRLLQQNPRNARAILGDAKRMRFENESGVTERVRAALEINPNLIEARVFLAELYLELDRVTRAESEIDEALNVNANSLEALTLLAAIRWREDDTARFESARARVFALNPRFADFYTVLSDVAARQRRYREAAAFARQATQLDSSSWRALALLGVNQLRLGRIENGRANLERAFEGDPFDVWTKNTLDLLDTFGEYRITRTPHFEILVHDREAELLSIYMEELVEEAYTALAQRYAYEPPTPIRVEVFPRHADFSVRTIGLVGMGALGVSFGPVIAMDSPSAREAGQFNWGATFWHELAHTFHLGLSDHGVPRWFTEGLAVFEERKARPAWGTDVTPGFLGAYRAERLFKVSELDEGFLRPRYPQQLVFSYYQASLVFEFIEQEWSFAPIKAMLRGYQRGQSTADVVQATLGINLDTLDERFDTYLRSRFAGPLKSIEAMNFGDSSAAGPRTATSRGRGPDQGFLAQLETGVRFYQQGDRTGAQTYFERAKELFPEYAGNDSPYWYLALIHREAGRPRQAAAELSALVAINENHYEAHAALAELAEAAGDTRRAADILTRAMYIYPFNPAPHADLARLAAGLADHATAVRERRAIVALDPVDRAEALYQLARAYLEAGHKRDARRTILRALEDAPSFAKGQDLLLEIAEPQEQRP